eukprot:2527466-Pyramimonas_sp.AAC.1
MFAAFHKSWPAVRATDTMCKCTRRIVVSWQEAPIADRWLLRLLACYCGPLICSNFARKEMGAPPAGPMRSYRGPATAQSGRVAAFLLYPAVAESRPH